MSGSYLFTNWVSLLICKLFKIKTTIQSYLYHFGYKRLKRDSNYLKNMIVPLINGFNFQFQLSTVNCGPRKSLEKKIKFYVCAVLRTMMKSCPVLLFPISNMNHLFSQPIHAVYATCPSVAQQLSGLSDQIGRSQEEGRVQYNKIF